VWLCRPYTKNFDNVLMMMMMMVVVVVVVVVNFSITVYL
jgi:hypothetical protein